MKFEYDGNKSDSNKKKHDINFHEAQALWKDDDLLEMRLKTVKEPRYIQIGMIAGKHWSAIVTYREDKIRIISVRRARKEEVAIYEKNKS